MKIIVFTVIEESNRYLMIQEASRRWKGKWFFPGGELEEKEIIESAARRETLEETGLHVHIHGIVHIDFFKAIADWSKVHIYLAATVTGGSLKQTRNRHSLKAAWKSVSEIRGLDLRDKIVLKIIERYAHTEALPLENFKVN